MHPVKLPLLFVERTDHLVLESFAVMIDGATVPWTFHHAAALSPGLVLWEVLRPLGHYSVLDITMGVVTVGTVLVDVSLLKLWILPIPLKEGLVNKNLRNLFF